MTFRCFIKGDPKPKGSKRAFVVKGRPVLVEGNKDTRSWEFLLAETFNAKLESVEDWIPAPFADAVEVTLVFQLRRPKAAKKRPWPHVRPDVDKLCRAVLDALVRAGVIRDDCQVVGLCAEKRYADVPGVQVEVRKLA